MLQASTSSESAFDGDEEETEGCESGASRSEPDIYDNDECALYGGGVVVEGGHNGARKSSQFLYSANLLYSVSTKGESCQKLHIYAPLNKKA